MLNRFLFLSSFLITCFLHSKAQYSFQTTDFQLQLNEKGRITKLQNSSSNQNFLLSDTSSSLLTIVSNGVKIQPTSAHCKPGSNKVKLNFAALNAYIEVTVIEKNTHLVLEITKVEPASKIDAIIWGPYYTTINKTIGEVIGVVRDGNISLGLQVLNVKTQGGDYPSNEGSTWARGIAAKPFKSGSYIQAYAINRDKIRQADVWGGNFKNMPVNAIKGESIVGSKIALFSCKEPETLDRLEAIELAENLPHPTINGVWFKKSPLFGKSYLISSFGEKEVDEMIEYTKRAGLISLYHEGPFKSWGHYILDEEQFPHGKEGMKIAVDKAHNNGLHLGVHTLTNFINTNDPYVTPVPDARLSATGSSILVNDMDASQKEIIVEAPIYFSPQQNNTLHTIKIGKELIRYKSVSEDKPYKLLDCQRGAFNTSASAHKTGEVVLKLMDHPYNVFFPNLDLQREIASNIASFLNETGVDHLDFDGLEGALSAGQGDYGIDLFAKDVYDQVKHDLIVGTSLSKTYFWHICSYYNWGEPWYGGFNESMQQYRIDNQALFERNYMPHMLGWYLLSDKTTLSEMEWMLARAAGYNAGFAMVARPKSLRSNPLSGELLDAIREWEAARNGHAFNEEQQSRLKNPKNEFHLDKIAEGKWNLCQYDLSNVFVREKYERQPGEPTQTKWDFNQTWKEQLLQFRLNVVGKEGTLKNIKLQVDQYADINLPIELQAGESLVCDGTNLIRIYDKNGKPKSNYSLNIKPLMISSGNHTIMADCSFVGDETPEMELQFKGMSRIEQVQIKSK
jgi:hypothetical protein